MIIDRCKEILTKMKGDEYIDKSKLKLELQTMATIINTRKTDLMINVYNDRVIHKEMQMLKEEND
jgi:H2-forming N5,N10-methylenetetrahydromethanopterin dehydrogenase-like enzyme